MRIQIVSDVHLERNPSPFEAIIDTGAKTDVMFLAGDIGCPYHETYYAFLKASSQAFQIVIVVAGNHEYKTSINMGSMDVVDAHIKNTCNSLCTTDRKVSYLQNGANVVVGDVNIVGATLWSHIPVDKVAPGDIITINNTYFANLKINASTPMTVETNNQLYNMHLRNVAKATTWGVQNKKKNVVVTHHAPIMEGVCKVTECPKNYMYVNDLYKHMNYSVVHTWVFGHTHWNGVHNINGTTVVCNQHGGNGSGIRGWTRCFVVNV